MADRLPWGTRKEPVRLGWAIEGARKKRLDAMAERAGVSSAVFLEAMIDHVEAEVTAEGLPSWWSHQKGVLPLPAA
ncbi:hypothetical protein [Arthrobacter sp. Soil736]|uniref:hypothetical protein n=1 Tax=Arthrobacter sp. Soil736 TaxID=1736395 RepID=UPI0012FBD970|nr:hypothetical protein [Arthrobacter sp. Soil736]